MPGTLHFSFDIDGDREVSVKLHGLMAAVTDFSPAFKVMARDWSTTMAAKFAASGDFETGTDEEGNPNPGWAPLAPSYAAYKQRRFGNQPLLVRTGALRQAAVNPREVITETSLRLTVASAYALYHQSSRPRTSNLPRRAFASLTAKQGGRWVRAVREQIKKAAEK